MTLRSSDLQIDSDLDSIRNSCDVFFLSHLLKLLHNTLGQPHMTAADLAVWVNDKLELVEEDHYSARTMVSWLHLCGFKVSTEYYRLLQSVTEYYVALQDIAGYCRVLQSITEYCRVLQILTEYYRVLQSIA